MWKWLAIAILSLTLTACAVPAVHAQEFLGNFFKEVRIHKERLHYHVTKRLPYERRVRARERARRARARGSSEACLVRPLRSFISTLRSKFGQSSVRTVATCSKRRKPNGKWSLHASGRAIDAKLSRSALRYARSHWKGSIITYGGAMHHVHLGYGEWGYRAHHLVNRNGTPYAIHASARKRKRR